MTCWQLPSSDSNPSSCVVLSLHRPETHFNQKNSICAHCSIALLPDINHTSRRDVKWPEEAQRERRSTHQRDGCQQQSGRPQACGLHVKLPWIFFFSSTKEKKKLPLDEAGTSRPNLEEEPGVRRGGLEAGEGRSIFSGSFEGVRCLALKRKTASSVPTGEVSAARFGGAEVFAHLRVSAWRDVLYSALRGAGREGGREGETNGVSEEQRRRLTSTSERQLFLQRRRWLTSGGRPRHLAQKPWTSVTLPWRCHVTRPPKKARMFIRHVVYEGV